MLRRTRLVLLVVLALPVAAGAAATGGSAPAVSVAADGTAVAGGETYVTRSDPTLSIDASVAPGAPNGTRIDVIAVHVDGTPHETFDVNATSVSRTIAPTFRYGNTEVKVIVVDTNEDVATTRITVQKDTRAPWINLSAPYHSPPGALVPDGEVNRSVVNVTGDIQELNRVRELRLTYVHGGSNHHGAIDVERRGRSFSERIVLGEGNNTIEIFTRDDLDNQQRYRFEITVNDTDAPSIELRPRANETNASTITVRGTIADAVWVANATIAVSGSEANASETATLLPHRGYEVSTERRSVTFEETIDLAEGENDVTITATDSSGHNATTSFAVTYEEPASTYRLPSVDLNRSHTRFTGPRRLRVAGSVTGTNLTHVAIEATSADGGETVGYVLVHEGTPRSTVPLDATIGTGGDVTRIVVRAVDERGGLQRWVVYANAATNGTFVGRDGVAPPRERTAVRTVAREPGTVVRTAAPAPTPTPMVRTVVHTRTRIRTHVERHTVTTTPNASGGPFGMVGPRMPDAGLPSFGLLPMAGVAAVLVVGVALLAGVRYRRAAPEE